MAESYRKGSKTLREKEKLLVTSNFSFSQCFQKTSTADTKNQGSFGKGLFFYQTIPGTNNPERILKNIVRKGEDDGNLSNIKYSRGKHFVVCKCLEFGLVQNSLVWSSVKILTLTILLYLLEGVGYLTNTKRLLTKVWFLNVMSLACLKLAMVYARNCVVVIRDCRPVFDHGSQGAEPVHPLCVTEKVSINDCEVEPRYKKILFAMPVSGCHL